MFLFVGGMVTYIMFGIVVVWALDGNIAPAPNESTKKKDLIQALGLIMAGVAGAIGIYFTWRGQRLAQRAQEETRRSTQEQLSNAQEQLTLTRQSQEQNQQATQAQLENTQEELRLNREGQITERFTRAIDQLGNESLEIRLGGIYALERLARESEKDHWPIMEVLTAYVRQHASRRPEPGQEGAEDTAEEKKEDSGDSREASEPTEVPAPTPDIQAIMTVIRRRTDSLVHGEPEPLDLRETNLRGANLSGANLRGANLGREVALGP